MQSQIQDESRYLESLSKALEDIQNLALKLHEKIEQTSFEAPLLALERRIFGASKRVSLEVRASILWQLFIFTRPISQKQERFQNSLQNAFGDASLRLLWRQLNTQRVKLWSYRRSLQNRGVGRTLAGPMQYQELFFDNVISADGSLLDAEHYLGFGCPVQCMEKNVLLIFAHLSQNQSYVVDSLQPYPKSEDDDAFWEEQLLGVIRSLYPACVDTRFGEITGDAHTDFNPELRLLRLQCLIQDANKIRYSENTKHSIRASLALATKGEAISEVYDIFAERRYQSDGKDPSTPTLSRFLAALGFLEDGQCPRAHRASLLGDPIALLLLSPDSPVLASLHSREPIRLALKWELENGLSFSKKAFEKYEIEQRWCASFDSFDLNNDDHMAVLSYVSLATDIAAIFPEEFFEMPLILPSGELAAIFLEEKMEAETCSMGKAMEFVPSLRRLKQSATLFSEAKRWLLVTARTWRSVLSEIETRQGVGRLVTDESRDRLKDGLQALMEMFK
ncbi:MAG: hypothetical protein WC966_01785 [Bradymonadales bacterium]|jgi:hypothetical protein